MGRVKKNSTRSAILEWLSLFTQQQMNCNIWIEASTLYETFEDSINANDITLVTFVKHMNDLSNDPNTNIVSAKNWDKSTKRYLYSYKFSNSDETDTPNTNDNINDCNPNENQMNASTGDNTTPSVISPVETFDSRQTMSSNNPNAPSPLRTLLHRRCTGPALSINHKRLTHPRFTFLSIPHQPLLQLHHPSHFTIIITTTVRKSPPVQSPILSIALHHQQTIKSPL